jgi:hypothetical protein
MTIEVIIPHKKATGKLAFNQAVDAAKTFFDISDDATFEKSVVCNAETVGTDQKFTFTHFIGQ